jgi:hypothetical protein
VSPTSLSPLLGGDRFPSTSNNNTSSQTPAGDPKRNDVCVVVVPDTVFLFFYFLKFIKQKKLEIPKKDVYRFFGICTNNFILFGVLSCISIHLPVVYSRLLSALASQTSNFFQVLILLCFSALN